MKRVLMALLMISCLSSVVGCAKKKGAASTPAAPVGVFPGSPTGGGTTPGITTGSETTMTLTTMANLRKFFFRGAINNVSNLRIGMDVENSGTGYGGEIWIAFEDGGTTREAILSTQHPWYPGTSDSSQNVWITHNGSAVFKGYFQDEDGSVIIILDDSITLGDGSPSEYVGGSVWFRNSTQSAYQNPLQGPQRMCWQIERGPYDCRAGFVAGTPGQYTTSGLYPVEISPDWDEPYIKLGTFNGLNRTAAMGQ